jgi:dihydrodipicolinate synthase/N-acetylneuraminate lyase
MSDLDISALFTRAPLISFSSPAPLKYAFSLLGLTASCVRLPLVEVCEPTKTEIAAVLTWACEIHADDMIGTMDVREQVSRRTAAR